MAYWEALHDFADRLNAFHISCGAPSYRDIAKASREPKLSQAGITEFLKGRRLPQLKALMEFIRVVSAEPAAATGEAAPLDAVREEWRSRWTHVRSLQRQAQDPLGHLKTTVKATLDQAEKEAEALRSAARGEAARIRAEAEAAAERLTASAKLQADELLKDAREQAERLRTDREMTESAQAASTGLLRLRRSLSRRGAVAAAVVLAVCASVVGVLLFHGQGPGPCRSASNAPHAPAASATYVGFQPVGVAARNQGRAGRVPDGFPTTTGWHLPTGPSASQSTPDSASASSPDSAGSSTSVTPTRPTGRPSASGTSSAHGCR
ncbi:hypothetical protein [Streptomyces sp. NPDC003273]|uniref:hypothetical protein n=1 Tax=Streptomyces sp. NPDC003273 TaxID=3364678 RepID=UPI00369F9F8E